MEVSLHIYMRMTRLDNLSQRVLVDVHVAAAFNIVGRVFDERYALVGQGVLITVIAR